MAIKLDLDMNKAYDRVELEWHFINKVLKWAFLLLKTATTQHINGHLYRKVGIRQRGLRLLRELN